VGVPCLFLFSRENTKQAAHVKTIYLPLKGFAKASPFAYFNQRKDAYDAIQKMEAMGSKQKGNE